MISSNKSDKERFTKEEKLLLEQWKKASELHQHEDDLSWRKFNYFTIINGTAISVLTAGLSGGWIKLENPILILIPLFGMFVSIIWAICQRRGQLYQNYRLSQVKLLEEKLKMDFKINGMKFHSLHKYGINEMVGRYSLDDCKYMKDNFDFEFNGIPKNWFEKKSTQSLMWTLAILFIIAWVIMIIYFIWHIIFSGFCFLCSAIAS